MRPTRCSEPIGAASGVPHPASRGPPRSERARRRPAPGEPSASLLRRHSWKTLTPSRGGGRRGCRRPIVARPSLELGAEHAPAREVAGHAHRMSSSRGRAAHYRHGASGRDNVRPGATECPGRPRQSVRPRAPVARQLELLQASDLFGIQLQHAQPLRKQRSSRTPAGPPIRVRRPQAIARDDTSHRPHEGFKRRRIEQRQQQLPSPAGPSSRGRSACRRAAAPAQGAQMERRGMRSGLLASTPQSPRPAAASHSSQWVNATSRSSGRLGGHRPAARASARRAAGIRWSTTSAASRLSGRRARGCGAHGTAWTARRGSAHSAALNCAGSASGVGSARASAISFFERILVWVGHRGSLGAAGLPGGRPGCRRPPELIFTIGPLDAHAVRPQRDERAARLQADLDAGVDHEVGPGLDVDRWRRRQLDALPRRPSMAWPQ